MRPRIAGLTRPGAGSPGAARPAHPEAAPPAIRRHNLALATLCLVLFLTFLDNTIVSVTLADIQTRLGAGVTSLQWIINGYALVFASLMLTAGALGDRLGRKKVMLAGVVVFCAGSVVAAVAPDSATLVAGRIVMGLGAAASEPGTLSMIRHLYPDRRQRARALGIWAATSGLALALGPVIGGVLVGLSDWRAVFWFNLGFGVLALALAAAVLPENADPTGRRLDVAGAVLGAAALACVTVAIITGEQSGYTSRGVLALFAGGAAAGVAFLVAEARSPSPVLNLGLFRRPAFSGSSVVAFTAYFGTFAIFFFVALYLQLVAGTSPYRTAVDFVPMTAAMIVASVFTGRWVAWTGPRVPMVFGCVAAGTGILLTDAVIGPHAGFGQLSWRLAVAGVGFGVAVVPVTSTALTVVPAERSGMAASATNTFRELGAVVGVSVLGAILNAQLTGDLVGRLRAIGIPAQFQSLVIDAVTHGGIPQSSIPDSPAVQAIVNKVLAAAYGAFAHGLDIALMLSGSLLLLSGVVAAVTIRTPRGETGAAGADA